MSSTIIQIGEADVKFGPVGAGGVIDPTTLTDFSCQVTGAAINSSSNTTTTSVPATFCGPASEASVPVASSFTLDLDFLQDWTEAAGLSAWLFKNDATEQAFALYLKGSTNPVATGKIIAQAGAFGGTPGEALTASVSLNIQGYPDIKDPTGASIRATTPPVVADPLNITAATFGVDPVPADLTALKADAKHGDAGTAAPAQFTTGQYVTLGDASKANFKTTGKWTAGAAT
jgi:hypothetical protein